jgi:hypothetical protein
MKFSLSLVLSLSAITAAAANLNGVEEDAINNAQHNVEDLLNEAKEEAREEKAKADKTKAKTAANYLNHPIDGRKLSSDKYPFDNAYTTIIKEDGVIIENDVVSRKAESNQAGSSVTFLGLLFRPSSVALDETDDFGENFAELNAGGIQPRDPDQDGKNSFFLAGKCTLISTDPDGRVDDEGPTVFIDTYRTHQCIYDLCLGGKGYDCINLYAGGGFEFNPFVRINVVANLGATPNPGETLPNVVITDNNREPPLPPPFQAVIFGGTGEYRLVEGIADVITVAGRTRGDIEFGIPQRGAIVQNFITHTNIELRDSKA